MEYPKLITFLDRGGMTPVFSYAHNEREEEILRGLIRRNGHIYTGSRPVSDLSEKERRQVAGNVTMRVPS